MRWCLWLCLTWWLVCVSAAWTEFGIIKNMWYCSFPCILYFSLKTEVWAGLSSCSSCIMYSTWWPGACATSPNPAFDFTSEEFWKPQATLLKHNILSSWCYWSVPVLPGANKDTQREREGEQTHSLCVVGIIERVSRFRCGGGVRKQMLHRPWRCGSMQCANIRECVAALWAGCNCGMWIYIESHNYRVASARRYSKGKSMCVIILSVWLCCCNRSGFAENENTLIGGFC